VLIIAVLFLILTASAQGALIKLRLRLTCHDFGTAGDRGLQRYRRERVEIRELKKSGRS
jgi:hypothetical protein